MRIFVIDPQTASRTVLVSRVHEAARRIKLRRIDVAEGDFDIVLQNAGREAPALAIFGPGCYSALDDTISRFRSFHPKVPISIVLDNDIYAAEALELRRFVSARIMPLADIAQLAQFVLDCSTPASNSGTTSRNLGIIGVVPLKGGVGVTTLAAALAGCYAEHQFRTMLVDLNDFNPHLTEWAAIGISQRRLIAACIEQGGVPEHRLQELLKSVEGFEGRLQVLGLPEGYRESFHLKADVLEESPSSSEYVESLITALRNSSDISVIDFGSSWGVAQLSALKLCDQIALVIDDDRTALVRSVKNLARLYRESDDPLEFDFAKWKIIVNGVTGRTLSEAEVRRAFVDAELFMDEPYTQAVPFSLSGREWSVRAIQNPLTLYDVGEHRVRTALEEIAHHLVPLPTRKDSRPRLSGTLRDSLNRIVAFLS